MEWEGGPAERRAPRSVMGKRTRCAKLQMANGNTDPRPTLAVTVSHGARAGGANSPNFNCVFGFWFLEVRTYLTSHEVSRHFF